MQQPELPNLPPIQSASPPPAPLAAPSIAPRDTTRTVPMTRRLRQMATVVMGGSVGLVALLSVAQLTFKEGLRPTDIAATLEAQTEIGIFNQKLGEERGAVTYTEADYRAKIAEAERSGQAKAELAFQKDLAVVQADKERVVGAYQTLHQRTNIIAQAGVQMEAQALQFRQQLVQQTNGGRAAVISVKDIFCGFGSPEACAAARQDRESMIEEGTTLTEGDIARKVNELMAGIPDPASLVAGRDIAERGEPKLPR